MTSLGAYALLAGATLPLWWPALRLILAEIRTAAEPEPLPPTPRGAPVIATPGAWSPSRSARFRPRLRWEGGFGRRSP